MNNSVYAVNYCKNLDTYMKSEGISGNQLATQSGISQKTIWVVQAGKTRPTVMTAEAIATALGLDARVMMGGVLSADQLSRSGRIGRMFDKLMTLQSEELKAVGTLIDSMTSKH